MPFRGRRQGSPRPERGPRWRRNALRRAAHGGLASLYALAALLGLFLHTAGEAAHARHVCEIGHADLEGDDDPARSIHDEARRALCHTFDRLAVALPEPSLALEAADPVEAAFLSPLLEVRSAFEVQECSRAPPLSLASC